MKTLKEIELESNVEKIEINNVENIYSYRSMRAFEKDIKMIAIDSPGLCYVVLKDFAFPSIERISNIYNKMKEDKKIYNTPIMFFSGNIFQMLILEDLNLVMMQILKPLILYQKLLLKGYMMRQLL